ncbi:MAG: hypothetical protein H0W72_11715 [Planctomycetes bacterium]|nr:hypothetical protein [Planctomycetota bacterium]
MLRPLACLLLAAGASLHAGMPSITLNEVAKFRFQSLSFFLVLLLVLAFVVWRIWNSLRADFPRLPALRFRAALGLMTLWGLLVLVVLTMISGARELMSPKAWVKTGLTYQLADEVTANAEARRHALEDLRDALWRWADAHDGALPAHEYGDQLPERRWQVPGTTSSRYRYDPDARGSRRLVAWEPDGVPAPRWVLRGDGTVETLGEEDLRLAVQEPSP